MNDIERIAQELMEQFGVTKLPEEFQITYKEQMVSQLNRRIGSEIMAKLSEADAKTYVELLGAGPDKQSEAQALLTRALPNLNEIIETAVADYAAEFGAAQQQTA